MAALMSTFDRMLGPLSPSSTAAHTSPPPKHVVVFTASGDQGRSVADALISDGGFIITAITKFPQSDAAHALKLKGARVVEADIADPASYAQCLEGVDAAFVNMDCEWIHGIQRSGGGRMGG